MPFDPSLPLPNSPLESQVIRDQLQALFVLINNIVTVTAAQVDGVNTLPAGEPASVNVSVTGGTLRFTFDIPRGSDGADGAAGEISQAQLDSAISGTSSNTNSVGTVDTSFTDPDVETLRMKVNELITALRR